MWRFNDLPLQKKISLIVVVGMVSAIFVAVSIFIPFDRDNVRRDLMEEMRILARITAMRSAVALAFGDRNNALENLNTLALRSTIQHACIYDKQQQLFAYYQRPDSRFNGCRPQLKVVDASFNSKIVEVIEPMFRKGTRLGYVLVATDLSPIEERTHKWVVTSFFVTLVAILLAFLVTRRMQHSVVKPIINLSDLMNKVRTTNDLTLRAKVYSHDEVGHMVDSFNEMLEILDRHNHELETLYRGLVEKSAEAEATAASLEARNHHMKELFGSAAHDLRQPLQAMMIFIDTLKKKMSNQDQLAIVDKLKHATLNLSQLFTEILDVSRYEFDFNIAGMQPTDIKQLLSKVYLEFEAMAQDKGLKLRFHSKNYKVMAHGALLERIIRNLLSNAIRYTESGGILLGCRARGQQLVIEVWDTGRGIPEQKREHIFSKFVQVNDSDREQEGGFGLGLAIVKQFADSLGYQLKVRSSVGRGTVFSLKVPLYIVDQKGKVHNTSVPSQPLEFKSLPTQTLDSLHNHRETRIVLLDDNDSVRAAVKLSLTEWGFAVDDFASISSMMGFFRQGGVVPDLVISDYQLSDTETGDQAINRLLEYLRCEIPAFIISASDDEAVWQKIRDSGYASMRKPVKPARFRALINHLLR